jgi:hypothetical protein
MSDERTRKFSISIEVAIEEKRLLYFLRDLKWGQVTLEVKAGKPVMIKAPRQDVKLTD